MIDFDLGSATFFTVSFVLFLGIVIFVPYACRIAYNRFYFVYIVISPLIPKEWLYGNRRGLCVLSILTLTQDSNRVK